jgi:hypothetical protein
MSNGEAPPQELTWSSTLLDLFNASYTFSDELVDPAKPPEFIRMYGDRWSVRWINSGVSDPAAQSCVDLYFSVRPVAPATITVKT